MIIFKDVHRAAWLAVLVMGVAPSGCEKRPQTTTSPVPPIRLGDFLSIDQPIEYIYAPATPLLRRPASDTGTDTSDVRREVFLPGTERYTALVEALGRTSLSERQEPPASFFATYANAPDVWAFESVPSKPAARFSLLRQRKSQQEEVAIAVGRMGFLVIERTGKEVRKFRADCAVHEWLYLARPPEPLEDDASGTDKPSPPSTDTGAP